MKNNAHFGIVTLFKVVSVGITMERDLNLLFPQDIPHSGVGEIVTATTLMQGFLLLVRKWGYWHPLHSRASPPPTRVFHLRSTG